MTIIKLCPKCKRPIKYSERYCDKCFQIHKETLEDCKRQSDKRYNKKREKKYIHFYLSKEWNILKNKRLQDSGYMCDRCKTLGINSLATEVHHIIPIQTVEGWNHRLDYNNTMSICLKCHNYYHKRFQRRKTNEATTNSNR